MSGAIESNIGSEALFAALQRGDSELSDKINESGMNCVLLLIKNVQEEAPHITYNLWSSITWESNGLFSWIVYPDEGIAPYALFVILEGVTRRYAGNPFMDRGYARSESEIQDEAQNLAQWVADLFN